MEHIAIQSSLSRRIAGKVLIFLPGLALAISSILKFVRVPEVVHRMAAAGFADGKLTLVAALEILSAILFLYRRSRSVGLLLLSSFLGGAICTHVQMGELPKAVPPALLLLLAWTGTYFQHPEMLWSLRQLRSAAQPGRRNRGADLVSREA